MTSQNNTLTIDSQALKNNVVDGGSEKAQKKSTTLFPKPQRIVSKVFIHCSDSDIPAHDNIAVIRQWHLERGWNDVGYHYFIRKTGEIENGRPLEKVPAAQQGHNTGSIAICVSGKKEFTDASMESLQNLCNNINDAYNNKITFHGHCEVSSKACPVFDYKKVLHLENGYIKKTLTF